MKKTGILIICCLLVFVLLFGVVACNDKNNTDLPGTAYEKVVFAFNGVESSFKEMTGAKPSNASGSKIFTASAADALATISGVYTAEDSQGDVIDELEYDQPPMIQFQYLKAVLNKIGEGFSFGTKYYYDITGTVYVDLAGNKKKASTDGGSYKYDYSFILAMEIDIDENDLIVADVSFDIKLTQGDTVYTTVWYVALKLDYDMTNLTPNYTLDMRTDEDELDMPSRNCYTLENDYVKVKDNKIEEWRKFCFETDRKLVKDGAHPTFDSYIEEGTAYNVDTVKWYKNADLKKITRQNETRSRTIACALFDLGLNSTDINGAAFLNKQGVVQNAVKTVYDDISEIWGDDIIYDIVIDEDAHDGENNVAPQGIAVRMGDDASADFGDKQWIVKNVTFAELLTDPTAWMDYNKEKNIMPVVYYVDEHGSNLRPIDSSSDLEFFMVSGGMEIRVEKTDKVVSAYLDNVEQSPFTIKIVLDNFSAVFCPEVRLDEGAIEEWSATSDESVKEIRDLGFPLYEEDIRVVKSGKNEYYLYDVDDWNDYADQLTEDGFIYLNSDGSILGRENGNELLQVRFFNDDEERIQLQIKENPFEEWAEEEIAIALQGAVAGFPGPKGTELRYVFDRSDGLSVTICGITENEKEQLKSRITDRGWVIVGGNGMPEVIRIVNENSGVYYELPFEEADHDILFISFNYQTYTMKKVTYSVNGGENKDFSSIGYGDWNEYSSTYYLYHYDMIPVQAGDTITFNATDFLLDSIELSNGASYGTLSGNVYTVTYSERTIFKITYYDRQSEDDAALRMDILPYEGITEYSCGIVVMNTPSGEGVTDEDRTVILNAFKNYFGTVTVGQNGSIDVSEYVEIESYQNNYINITFFSELKRNQVEAIVGSVLGELGGEGYPCQTDKIN